MFCFTSSLFNLWIVSLCLTFLSSTPSPPGVSVGQACQKHLGGLPKYQKNGVVVGWLSLTYVHVLNRHPGHSDTPARAPSLAPPSDSCILTCSELTLPYIQPDSFVSCCHCPLCPLHTPLPLTHWPALLDGPAVLFSLLLAAENCCSMSPSWAVWL